MVVSVFFVLFMIVIVSSVECCAPVKGLAGKIVSEMI